MIVLLVANWAKVLRYAQDFGWQLRRRQDASSSGNLSSLLAYFRFHSGLRLQALEIARDGCDSKSAAAFLICHRAIAGIDAPVGLDSIPLLGMAHVIDSHIVVLTPKEWDSVKVLAMAEDIPGRYLPLALGNNPVLHANTLAGVRIWPAGGIAGSKDSSHAGLEVFVDSDTAINGEPRLLG